MDVIDPYQFIWFGDFRHEWLEHSFQGAARVAPHEQLNRAAAIPIAPPPAQEPPREVTAGGVRSTAATEMIRWRALLAVCGIVCHMRYINYNVMSMTDPWPAEEISNEFRSADVIFCIATQKRAWQHGTAYQVEINKHPSHHNEYI